MRSFAAATFALFVAQALAGSPSSFRELMKRQPPMDGTDDIPDACITTCEPVFDVFDGCSAAETKDPTCFCTEEVTTGLGTCLDCVLEVRPTEPVLQEAQRGYDDIVNYCKGVGVELPASSFAIPDTSTTPATGNDSTTVTTTTTKTTTTTTTKGNGGSSSRPGSQTSAANQPANTGEPGGGSPTVALYPAVLVGAVAGAVFAALL